MTAIDIVIGLGITFIVIVVVKTLRGSDIVPLGYEDCSGFHLGEPADGHLICDRCQMKRRCYLDEAKALR